MSGTMTTESYVARVTANDDPEKRGRVRVSCVGLLGDDETALPMWVEPIVGWGLFLIPDVGEIIEIECDTGSDQDESKHQFSIDNLNIRWKGIRWYSTDEAVPRPINPQFTAENYAKRRGFATPEGHVVMFDDTPGSTSIKLTWIKVKEQVAPAQVTTMEFDKLGNININVLDKHKININVDSLHLAIDAKHLIDLTADDLNVTLGGGKGVDLKGHDADAVMTIGDGAVHATVVEHMETLYGQLKTYIENALVNTGLGPSATIKATVGPAPAWDKKINSTSLAMPDTK